MRAVAAAAGASVDTISRLERGEPSAYTITTIAKVAEIVGLELAASLHPNADPVRDRGHLALLDRLRKRLGSSAKLRMEVPVPLPGDLRSGDAMLEIGCADGLDDALIEAETHLGDIQLIERASGGQAARSRREAAHSAGRRHAP